MIFAAFNLLHKGHSDGSCQSYSIVKIESAIFLNSPVNNANASSDAYDRISLAGRDVVNEFDQIFDSGNAKLELFGANIPSQLWRNNKWDSVPQYVLGKIKSNPSKEMVGYFLLPIYHESIKPHKEFYPHIAKYLDDDSVVVTMVKNSPENTRDIRVKDIVAYIIQEISGNYFGAKHNESSDDAVTAAKKWVAENKPMK